MLRYLFLILFIAVSFNNSFAQIKSFAAKEKVNEFSKSIELYLNESYNYIEQISIVVFNANANKENFKSDESDFLNFKKFEKKLYHNVKNVPKIMPEKQIVFLQNDMQQLNTNFANIYNYYKNFKFNFYQLKNKTEQINTLNNFIDNETLLIEKSNVLIESIFNSVENFNNTAKLILPQNTYNVKIDKRFKKQQKKETKSLIKAIQKKVKIEKPAKIKVEKPVKFAETKPTINNFETENNEVKFEGYIANTNEIIDSKNPYYLPQNFKQSNNLKLNNSSNNFNAQPKILKKVSATDNLNLLMSEDFNLISEIYHNIINKNYSNLLIVRLQLNQLNFLLANRKNFIQNNFQKFGNSSKEKKFYNVLQKEMLIFLNALFLKYSVSQDEKVFDDFKTVYQLQNGFQKLEYAFNGYNF